MILLLFDDKNQFSVLKHNLSLNFREPVYLLFTIKTINETIFVIGIVKKTHSQFLSVEKHHAIELHVKEIKMKPQQWNKNGKNTHKTFR